MITGHFAKFDKVKDVANDFKGEYTANARDVMGKNISVQNPDRPERGQIENGIGHAVKSSQKGRGNLIGARDHPIEVV